MNQDPSTNSVEEPVLFDTTNAYVDKLTLELLLNKTHYQKYLAKTDPQLYAEQQEFLGSCSRFRRQIVDMTARLLDDPKCSQYNSEVCDAFNKYAQTLIRYLEIKEMSDNAQKLFDSDSAEEDDMLFHESMNRPVSRQNRRGTLDAFVLRR
jgi:hypothetical protein